MNHVVMGQSLKEKFTNAVGNAVLIAAMVRVMIQSFSNAKYLSTGSHRVKKN
jgi:hypothetical protein